MSNIPKQIRQQVDLVRLRLEAKSLAIQLALKAEDLVALRKAFSEGMDWTDRQLVEALGQL